jgi:hypothetical protein
MKGREKGGSHVRFRNGSIATAVFLGIGAFFFLPGAMVESGSSQFYGGIAIVIAAAALIGVLTFSRWYAWAVTTGIGYLLGLWEASTLLAPDTPVEAYDLALVTALLYGALGFSLGMVAEFVRFLHYLSHGGKKNISP